MRQCIVHVYSGMSQSPPRRPGRIVRLTQPRNEELDLSQLGSLLTPNEQFYVRCHGPEPSPPADWRLTIDGLVRRPLSLRITDVRAMPQVEAIVTLECAGNRRTLQRPRPGGVPWVNTGISGRAAISMRALTMSNAS